MITKRVKIKKSLTKKITNFKIQLRSRHPSHQWLRDNLGLLPFRSIVRLGSTTHLVDTVTNGGKRIECNTVESVKVSSNKLLMKQTFNNNVKSANWWTVTDFTNQGGTLNFYGEGLERDDIELVSDLPYPIVAKHIYGSRGEGNFLLNNQEELQTWLQGKNLTNYIFEKFYNYSREYRLHVTKDGCFYTCRKMLKEETPQESRWYRNDSNCNWVTENHELFDKPVNWDSIVQECVKALNVVGLDIGGFDVKVQSRLDKKGRTRENPEFIIIESNSACSHGEITKVKYKDAVIKVLIDKYRRLNNI